MITFRNLLGLFLIVFLVSETGYSQQNKSSTLPLKEILKNIQKQHDVQFSYLEEEVSVIRLVPPGTVLPLEEKIHYLENITSLNFHTISDKYIVITAKNKISKSLTDSLLQLDIKLSEIKIERYLTTGVSKKINGTFTIQPKKFGILPGLIEPDVLQAMQQIPGIYSADETISNINVRSGTHDQNLFLWNGIRMFQTGHFFGMISAFNPSIPNKISIFKNGTSAFYGESTSSVVDISSHSGNIKTANSISANLINCEANFKIKTSEKSTFQISGRRSFTDFAASATYNSYYNRVFQNTVVTNTGNNQDVQYHSKEHFYFYDFTAQYQQEIGANTEFSLDFIGINNSLKINQDSNTNNIFKSKENQLDQQNFGGNISFKTNFSERNALKINFYASYYNLDSSNETAQNNQILQQQNTVFDTGFRSENRYVLNDNFVFKSGYQYNEIGVTNYENINNPAFIRNIKEVLRSHALVFETEFKSNNQKTFLRTGLRNNYIERFSEFIIEPRVQFNYIFSEKLSLEVLGERKSQTTSQIIDLQQDFLGIEKRRWVVSDNNNIPVQKSNQFSVGGTFKDKNWLVTFDSYYKKVDGIHSPSQAFQNQLEFVKVNGNYSVIGSEVLLQRNFRHFYSWLSYSISKSQYTFNSITPSQFANNFQMVHNINWAGIYEWNNIKIALGTKWHSGRPETTPYTSVLDKTNPVKPEIVYNSPNNQSISDFFEINFSAGYNWMLNPNTNLQLGCSLLNIFNKQNIVNSYYRVNKTNESIERVNTFALKRTFNLSAKFSF